MTLSIHRNSFIHGQNSNPFLPVEELEDFFDKADEGYFFNPLDEDKIWIDMPDGSKACFSIDTEVPGNETYYFEKLLASGERKVVAINTADLSPEEQLRFFALPLYFYNKQEEVIFQERVRAHLALMQSFDNMNRANARYQEETRQSEERHQEAMKQLRIDMDNMGSLLNPYGPVYEPEEEEEAEYSAPPLQVGGTSSPFSLKQDAGAPSTSDTNAKPKRNRPSFWQQIQSTFHPLFSFIGRYVKTLWHCIFRF